MDRLEEMGYDRSDALRIIRVAMQDRDILDARSRRAMAQTDKERQRALAAEIRASERQTAQARRQLASTGTPARLAQWLKKGLITRMEAYRRLVRMGWTEVDANRHLDAAEPLPPRVRPEPIMDPNAPAERQR